MEIKTKLLTFLALLLLTGCATQPKVVYQTKEVKVPIYYKIQVPYRPLPELLTSNLTEKSSNSDVIKAYYLDHDTLLNELIYFRSVIYDKDSNSNYVIQLPTVSE